MDESETPNKSRVVLRAALDAEIKTVWFELVKRFCDRSFKDFAPPCKCQGNDARRLVNSSGQGTEYELPGDSEIFGPDPFDPVGVGELGGGE